MKLKPRIIASAFFLTLLLPFAASAYYSPEQGRWMSRDPIEEEGGRNTHAFVANDPNGKVDVLGQDIWSGPPAPLPPVNPSWPVDSYNCAGCAFRVFQYMSKSDTVAKLARDCSRSDGISRCPCGLRKCHYYDITSWAVRTPNGSIVQYKADDFHIDCGNEDGFDCTHKNGPNPPIAGTDIYTYPAGPSNPIPPGYKVEAIYIDAFYCCNP